MFAYDKMFYMEKTTESNKKLLELINWFNKAADYKVSTYMKLTETEIKKNPTHNSHKNQIFSNKFSEGISTIEIIKHWWNKSSKIK